MVNGVLFLRGVLVPGQSYRYSRSVYLLVYIIFDRQQIVTHSLKGQFVKYRGAGVETAVQNQELGARLVWALEGQTQGLCSGATCSTAASPTSTATVL